MNILYIEDDQNIAEIYVLMLKEHFENIEIKHFLDGEKAIEELKKNHTSYNLVISDFKLPNISGAEIFKFVSGQMLGIPFIILSGYDCSKDENLKFFFDSHVRNAFLVKPTTIDELAKKIQWCLAVDNNPLTVYLKEATHHDEKIAINSDVFLKLNYVPCDVYLKINKGKFVKIIKKKEIYENSLIKKLIMKGTTHFFVNRSELSQYGESVVSTLNVMIKTKKNKINDQQKSQLATKAIEVIKSNLLKCGFNKTLMDTTDELVTMQLDLIDSAPEFASFLEKFQNFRMVHADHVRLVSYICVSILKELEWDSETTVHRMCMAVMLHDISLPDGILKLINETKDLQKLSEKDRMSYFSHPEVSSHIAKNFEKIAPGIDQYILEHHESPDGRGFPKKLNFNNIHPLSAVLHISDLVADLLWEHGFEMDKVKDDIRDMKANYQRGFYRKPFEALLRTLKVTNF